jgi:hypothetical protein
VVSSSNLLPCSSIISIEVSVTSLVDLSVSADEVSLPGLKLPRALPSPVPRGASHAGCLCRYAIGRGVLACRTAAATLASFLPNTRAILPWRTEQTVILRLGAAVVVVPSLGTIGCACRGYQPFRGAVSAGGARLALLFANAARPVLPTCTRLRRRDGSWRVARVPVRLQLVLSVVSQGGLAQP